MEKLDIIANVINEEGNDEDIEVTIDIDELLESKDQEDKINYIKQQVKRQHKTVKKVFFDVDDLKDIEAEIEDLYDVSDMLPNETYDDYMEHEDF